jgi:hypothetical protein
MFAAPGGCLIFHFAFFTSHLDQAALVLPQAG